MPTPASKSPVKLSMAILGIVFVLCLGGYLARETLLVGVIKFGVYVDSPKIIKEGLSGVWAMGGSEKTIELINSDDTTISKAIEIYLSDTQFGRRRKQFAGNGFAGSVSMSMFEVTVRFLAQRNESLQFVQP